MLRPRDRAAPQPGRRTDGITSISVLLLSIVGAGLLVAAVLATYDYATPASEAPLLRALTVVFGLAVVLNVLAAAVRHARRH